MMPLKTEKSYTILLNSSLSLSTSHWAWFSPEKDKWRMQSCNTKCRAAMILFGECIHLSALHIQVKAWAQGQKKACKNIGVSLIDSYG